MPQHRAITEQIIGLAIDVNRTVGSGLVESVYAENLYQEPQAAGLLFQSQVILILAYKQSIIPVGDGGCIDLLSTLHRMGDRNIP